MGLNHPAFDQGNSGADGHDDAQGTNRRETNAGHVWIPAVVDLQHHKRRDLNGCQRERPLEGIPNHIPDHPLSLRLRHGLEVSVRGHDQFVRIVLVILLQVQRIVRHPCRHDEGAEGGRDQGEDQQGQVHPSHHAAWTDSVTPTSHSRPQHCKETGPNYQAKVSSALRQDHPEGSILGLCNLRPKDDARDHGQGANERSRDCEADHHPPDQIHLFAA
mmetsp:Transcript_91492/g.218070  ORF Transcript_91492/g.218070 Transcript_91492/m.218070 type:complete len:217 (+) Transcript_91492:654-1304(+)